MLYKSVITFPQFPKSKFKDRSNTPKCVSAPMMKGTPAWVMEEGLEIELYIDR